MGFFSWKTQDTNESIPSVYSNRDTFPVTMIDNKGNKWTETAYEGYGVFDGKDFYELLAEMNGEESDRNIGIRIYYGEEPFLCPNLNENPNAKWENAKPKDCEYQGFFYDDDDDNDDY